MEANIQFTVKLADLTVGIKCRYPSTKQRCEKYIVEDKKPDFSVFATDSEIEQEVNALEGSTPEYSEFLCIYRNIARKLPEYSRAVFHGAAITYKGKGLLFTAPSGTGKSTHIKLWRKFLGEDVKIVNGDKPIIKTDKSGLTVYGTPWAGKENWHRNVSAKVEAICLLKQGTEISARQLNADQCITAFMHQIYLPDIPDALRITLSVLSDIIETVPVYEIVCDISEDSVKKSFETVFKEEYKA